MAEDVVTEIPVESDDAAFANLVEAELALERLQLRSSNYIHAPDPEEWPRGGHFHYRSHHNATQDHGSTAQVNERFGALFLSDMYKWEDQR